MSTNVVFSADGPRVFRLPPELRRCCWYCILGSVLLAVVFVEICANWPLVPAAQGGAVSIAMRAAMFPIIGAFFFLLLRWRLLLDSDGVSQRWLLWQTWPWSDFATARIKKTRRGNIVDPLRPWWRRRLFLSMLSTDDFRKVSDAINEHYRLPALPPQPESLEFRYGFRRKAVFDSTGVHLSIKGVAHDYTWDEVVDVHITRLDPLRRDFQRLEFLLPDQEIELFFVSHQGGTTPTWHGTTSEQIDEALRLHVAEEKITATIRGQPLVKPLHVEKALNRFRERQRRLYRSMRIFGPLFAGLLIAMPFACGPLKAAVMIPIYLLIFVPLTVSRFNELRREISALQSRLDELRANANPECESSGPVHCSSDERAKLAVAWSKIN